MTYSEVIAVMQNRQTGRRPVSPRNDSPRWPEGYVEVLREAGAIEKTIPYHMAWVIAGEGKMIVSVMIEGVSR